MIFQDTSGIVCSVPGCLAEVCEGLSFDLLDGFWGPYRSAEDLAINLDLSDRPFRTLLFGVNSRVSLESPHMVLITFFRQMQVCGIVPGMALSSCSSFGAVRRKRPSAPWLACISCRLPPNYSSFAASIPCPPQLSVMSYNRPSTQSPSREGPHPSQAFRSWAQ